MLETSDKTIKISRGDTGNFILTIPISNTENYTFKVGDKIQFRVFEKKNYNNVVLDKEILVTQATTELSIELDENDTMIGETINKPATYWFEISLNETQTVICYDDEGPAEFILYPAKGV